MDCSQCRVKQSSSCSLGYRWWKSLELAIIENVQRQDLNIIEEAKGYQRLIQEFGYDHEKFQNLCQKAEAT